MSVKAMAVVWELYPAGGGELLTALKLADHADHDGGNIWPGVESVARTTHQSERTIQRHIQAMLKSGWLEVVWVGGRGPASPTRYRMPLAKLTQSLGPRVTDCHPQKRVTSGKIRVTSEAKKGDTAMSPEPSLKQSPENQPSEVPGRAEPSPVAKCFRAYQAGMKRKYGGEYPPSAKANGQLAQLVARVGAEAAPAVVDFYLASSNPWYIKVRHKLDFLLRDAEQIFMDMQASGPAGAPPPTHARVALLASDGKVLRELDRAPAGDMEAIAKKARQDYSNMIARLNPKYVAVRQGSERRQYSIEEL